MRKIRTGLYETTIAGHRVEVERLPKEHGGEWTYYVETFRGGGKGAVMSDAADPWATRADALWSAEQGIKAGLYGKGGQPLIELDLAV